MAMIQRNTFAGKYLSQQGKSHEMMLTAARDAEGVEKLTEEEAERIQAVSDQFSRFQMMNFNEHHHCLRGTHLKTQGVWFRLHP